MVLALKEMDFTVLTAFDGVSGVNLVLTQPCDLVILDILLPGLNGWEVCKQIRKRSVVPILMLTALSEELDRILGLELGADDYLTKPFSTRELLAHIKALLRRVEFDSSWREERSVVVVDKIKINLEQRQVYKNDQELVLRFKEFELLSLMVSKAGEIVTRAEIFDKVWGTD